MTLITSSEACQRLGIDRSTLSRWVAAGLICPGEKLPGRRGAFLFTADEIKRREQEINAPRFEPTQAGDPA